MKLVPLSITCIILAAGSFPALAHVGNGATSGFTHGLEHPIFGIDHLLAMVTVGLWAGLSGGTARWFWPTAFVGAMVLGALAGMAGLTMPFVEPVILASVIVLGAAVAVTLHLSLVAGAVLIAVFGLFHGYAHGAEAPTHLSSLAYIAGFAVATAALHGFGLLLSGLAARLRDTHLVAIRTLGGVVGISGLWLAVS